jgi:hypothetical protein
MGPSQFAAPFIIHVGKAAGLINMGNERSCEGPIHVSTPVRSWRIPASW